MPCDNHKLVDILRANVEGVAGVEDVARWCEVCGAITVETEISGAVQAYARMSLRLPSNAPADNERG